MIGALLQRVLTLFAAVTLAFFALRLLPGEALRAELVQAGADSQTIAAQQAALGLDRPLLEQYGLYLGGLLRGDLGTSLVTRQPVTLMIAVSLPSTLSLALSAFGIAVGVGLALGGVAALSRGGIGRAARALIALLMSVPIYWSGTLAIYLFSAVFNWLPSSGSGDLSRLILPASILGLHTSAAIARSAQLALYQSMRADFVRTARAKGLRERRVIGQALHVGIIPVITTAGLQAGFLLGGTVITEMLFVRPGIGRMMLDAAARRDYPVLLGGVLITATGYIIANTFADLLSRRLDPRIRAV